MISKSRHRNIIEMLFKDIKRIDDENRSNYCYACEDGMFLQEQKFEEC